MSEKDPRIIPKNISPCIEVQSMLGDYIDGTLASEKKLLVEDHMHNCQICAEIYKGILEVIDIASQLPDREVPEGVSMKLRETLKNLF